MANKEISFPNEPRIVLTMSREPEHSTFTRYLSFQGHAGSWKRLAVAFRKVKPKVYESDSFPDGIGTLEALARSGNRNFWDAMFSPTSCS